MIEPQTREEFERAGLETIRLLTHMGNFDGGDHIRNQALEWISEQTKLRAQKERDDSRDQSRMMLWTKIGALAASIAAIAALIPLSKGN